MSEQKRSKCGMVSGHGDTSKSPAEPPLLSLQHFPWAWGLIRALLVAGPRGHLPRAKHRADHSTWAV